MSEVDVPEETKTLNVFIGSPGDVLEERKIFRDVIKEVNRIKAESMGYRLKAIGWEDTMPGKGRPQALINKDVKKAHLAVFVLWKRWGSPTDEEGKRNRDKGKPFVSGMKEEFRLADGLSDKNGSPEIFLYFKGVGSDMMGDPGYQFRQVLDFRREIEESKRFLFVHYDNIEQWKETLRAHLCTWLDRYNDGNGDALKKEILVENEKMKVLIDERDSELLEMSSTIAKLAVEKSNSGSITEAEELFAKATSSKISDPYAISAYGNFLKMIGQLDSAYERYSEVLRIGEISDKRELISNGLCGKGLVCETRGELDKALEMHKKALEIDSDLGNKKGMARHISNIGNIYRKKGELDEALEIYEKALEIDNEVGNKKGMAYRYGNIGVIHQIRNELDEALEMYEKTLEISEDFDLKHISAPQYGNIGIISEEQGDYKKAHESWTKARDLWKEIGNVTQVEKYQKWIDDLPE